MVSTLALTAAAAAVVLLGIGLRAAFAKKLPTKYTLPNGKTVTQWQKGETDYLYGEIFTDELYAKGIKIAKGMTIFDVGANIGMFSLFCLWKTGGDVNLFSFEPMPSIHACLEANAKQYGGGRCKAFRCGLSDAEKDVTFEFHPNFSLWSTVDSKFDKQRESRISNDIPAMLDASPNAFVRNFPRFLMVPVARLFVKHVLNRVEHVKCKLRTLSNVIDEQGVKRIDLLKVDVEGSEIFVLQGIRREHWAMIQQVVLEVESFDYVRRVRAILEPHGFVVESVASEQLKAAGVTSEVSLVTAVRK